MSSPNNRDPSGPTGNASKNPSPSNQPQNGAGTGALKGQLGQPTSQHQQHHGRSVSLCFERWKGEDPAHAPFGPFGLKGVSARHDKKREEVIDRGDAGGREEDILGSSDMFPFDDKAAQIEGSSGPSKRPKHGLPATLGVKGYRTEKSSRSTK